MVMAMKSKIGEDVYDDPGMSTSATQRGVMLRIMIEKQPMINTNTQTWWNKNLKYKYRYKYNYKYKYKCKYNYNWYEYIWYTDGW